MIGRYVKGKVYVFIDAANIFYSQKTLGWRISYKKLQDYFKAECDVGKIYVYIGTHKDDNKQKKFIDMLDINGFIVRTKPVKKITVVPKQYIWKANFDVELAFDMDDEKINYDTAILMSGDSDFAFVIDRIKKAGKRIIVMSTRGHIALELLKRAKYIDLRKLKGRLIL